MKQTNGAILLLQNAFKGLALRSYLKGIASAVVLTAGLSAGAASAADEATANPALAWAESATGAKDITISGDYSNENISGKYADDLVITGTLTNSTNGSTAPLFADTVTVDGGTLTIDNSKASSVNADGHGILGWTKAISPIGEGKSTFTVTGNAEVNLTKTAIQFLNVNLASGEIVLGGNFGTSASGADWNTSIFAANDDEGDAFASKEERGNLIIGGNGSGPVITMNAGSQLRGFHVEMNGGTVTLNGNDNDFTSGSTAVINTVVGGDIELNDGTVDVQKYGAVQAKAIALNGTEIKVGESGNLELGDKGKLNSGSSDKNSDITMTGGTIINQGTLTVGTGTEYFSTTFTATGGTITNSGTMTFNGTTNLAGAEVSNSKAMTVKGDLTVSRLSALYNNATTEADKASLTVSGDVTVEGVDDINLVTGYGFTNSATAGDDTTLTALESAVTIDSTYNTKFDTINADSVKANTEDGTFTITSGSTVSAVSGFDLSSVDDDGDKTLTVAGTLTLGDGFTGSGSLGGSDGLNIDVNDATAGNASFTVEGGTWNLESLTLTSGNASVSAGASLTAEQLNVIKTNTGALTVAGTLTVTGDSDEGKDSSVDVQVKGTVNVNEGGRLVITGADAINDVVTVKAPATGTTYNTATVNSTNWTSGGVTVNGGGVLELQLGSDVVFQNAAAVQTLKSQLWAAASKGILNIGDASYGVKAGDDGMIDYTQLAAGVSTNATATAQVKVAAATASSGIVANEYGSVYVDDSKEATATTDIKLAGGTIFNKSNDKNSFASSAKTEVLNLEITSDDGAVVFNGAGEIGSLTQTAGVSGAVLFQAGAGTQTVGAITLHKATVGTGAVVSDDNVDVTEFVLNAGTSYNNYDDSGVPGDSNQISVGKLTAAGEIATNTLTIKAASAKNSTSEASANIFAENFEIEASTGTFTNKFTVSNGATLTADTVTLGSGASVILGTDGDDSSAGYADMGKLVMGAGSNIVIDPEYGENVGLAVAESIVDTADAAVDNPDMKLSGNLLVGQNSAFGLGFETVDELRAAIGEYLTNGSLSRDDVGAIAYLNKSLALGNGTNSGNIYLDADGTNSTLGSHSFTTSGSVTLGANTALIIGDTVDLTDEAAITDVTSVSGATGSKVIIKGVYSVKDTLQLIDGKAGSSVTDAGLLSTIEVGEGGLLVGDAQTAGGNGIDIKLTKAEDFDEKLYNVSSPVNALYNHVYDGNYSSEDAGVEYIYGVGGHDGGKSVEATSRLGVYGGAVQAAMLASQTSTDAVADRLGMASSNSALVYADNAQGGGLWLMPVYRSLDSDGFNAQGVDYGTDIDLYGVALGADFTTDSGVRVGGYFNVGSGDADGQQVASEVSNDFDYYGVGIYAGMNFGQFGLIADIGFTQVSNDLEQNAYYAGKLTADADSSAVTAGLRAEYALELAAVDVVPHLGVRYTRLDMDSYDVTGADGVYASTSSDSMSVFSIPFGVSVSTDIEAGNWSVKPVFDLTLTANTGDDELDSDTTFTGAGMTSALSTEVLDSFTYGGTVGVQAKYGESLSLGVGLNYTGSDNTDAFGVTGDIRYMF